MKRKIQFILILFSFFTGTIFAQTYSKLFDDTWTADEIQNLEKGEIVIRNVRRKEKISILKGTNKHSDEIVKSFNELNPVYLAEIIYKMPKHNNENIMQQAVEIFRNIDLYKEIIYIDEKKMRASFLFPMADLMDSYYSKDYIWISTHLQMDMLSDYNSQLIIKNDKNGFYFEQKNKSPLKWKSFTAVKPENMRAGICCFEYGDEYYVYALGGIKAPQIPFVLREIERQFIGRIKDFTVFYIKKFDIKR